MSEIKETINTKQYHTNTILNYFHISFFLTEKPDCFNKETHFQAGKNTLKHKQSLFLIGQFDLSLLYLEIRAKKRTTFR